MSEETRELLRKFYKAILLEEGKVFLSLGDLIDQGISDKVGIVILAMMEQVEEEHTLE